MDIGITWAFENQLRNKIKNRQKETKRNIRYNTVCKHWLKHNCPRDEACTYLHVYDLEKMPLCPNLEKQNGECTNIECFYQHVQRETSKTTECEWFKRGYCRRGPSCLNVHVPKKMCRAYFSGFCINGPKCSLAHIQFQLPTIWNKTFFSRQRRKNFRFSQKTKLSNRKLALVKPKH
jgi:hypothetical protein